MKIEVGKYYKTAEGHKVGPAVKSGDSASFSLFDRPYLYNMFYHSNGECHVGDGKYDLVAEWEEPKVEYTTEPSGRVTVDITDRIDDIIRQDLEWCALQMLKEGNDKREFIGNKAELFASFCRVIEYYSTKKQWEDFVAKTEGKKVE